MTTRMLQLEDLLQQRFGIDFLCETLMEGGYPVVLVRLADLKEPHGFSIRIKFSWKSLGISFVPDSFSGDLIRDMGQSKKTARIVSSSFAGALNQYGSSLDVQVNGDKINLADIDSWPVDWTTLVLNYNQVGVEPDLDQIFDGGSVVLQQCLNYLGVIVPLLPIEKGSYEVPLEGLPEGLLFREETNRYERNRLNREACIAIKGTTCLVCGFNFAETFGDIGDGYIHVHHVIPVSQLGEGYIVDPSSDLVPVCANCHSMMHRTDPPVSVDELRSIMNKHR